MVEDTVLFQITTVKISINTSIFFIHKKGSGFVDKLSKKSKNNLRDV